MDAIEHGIACYDARLAKLKLFWLARGHSADEAHDYASRHMRGETVPINDAPDAAVQPGEPVLAESDDSGSSGGSSTAT